MQIDSKEGTILVTRTVLKQTTQNEEKIEIRPFVTDTATIGFRLDKTKNIGNYENVKVGVFISVPCYKEEIVKVFRQVEHLAKKLMTEQLDKLED